GARWATSRARSCRVASTPCSSRWPSSAHSASFWRCASRASTSRAPTRRPRASKSAVEVRFLGTGSASSPGGRGQSAIVVADGTTTLLLDFGSTGLAALTAIMDPARVDGIVVTHLHGDHFGAIPYLVMQQRFASRARPLILAGPPGLEARLRQLSLALYADFYERPLPYELRFVPFGDGELAIGAARIAARRVMHSPDAEPHGVRLRMGGRLIAYTGDAGWSEDLPAPASGADLLICEPSTYAS